MTFSRGLSELVLIVSDVQRSAAFYRDVVGLVPEKEPSEEWAWFWAGEPGVRQRLAVHRGSLLFEEHSPLPEGERWGRVHFALEVPADRLEAAAEHVRKRGVEVYGPTHFDWMRSNSYYFYDPDGNLIELWSPEEDGSGARGDGSQSG
jgi:catechol 2,3-dioxygenase-like lactoylglutathione lyase family enzyme